METACRSHRRFVTYTIIGGAALVALAAVAAPRLGAAVRRQPQPGATAGQGQTAVAKRPRVEVVFALDTTGSMSGLIEGAKRKIWSLASFVAQGQPTPELRVGLVGYRDVGDAYVTRLHDLDDDLDRVYQRLNRFQAA